MIFKIKKILRNFKFAFDGLRSATSEQTFQIFCVFAVAVIFLMFLFGISFIEKLILILTISFAMALELINSQIEKVLDIFQPNHDPKVKVIKDISAGAVLIVCFGALIIGILIFWPYLKEFLEIN